MTLRKFLLIFILSVFSFSCVAQKVHVKASNENLSSVVKRLNAQVSFDNKLLSPYKVTVDKVFPSPYKALLFLIAGKPLQLRNVAGVFVITAKPQPVVKHKPQPAKKAEVKHPIRNVPVAPNVDLTLSLKEIVITARNHSPILKDEVTDGMASLNSSTANAMPGHPDNMVFNVLRMMPGIRASGEPSDELFVWGSSPGESRVSFDGIPLFSLQSYNSNVSYINPYMVDLVKYRRGALSASEDSQTGAKIDVLSGESQITRPVFKAMVGTLSANCFTMFPIGKKCFLSMAYRHTLNGLFSGTVYDSFRSHNEDKSSSSSQSGSAETRSESTHNSTGSKSHSNLDYTAATPKYRFQDANINFTATDNHNNYYRIAAFGAEDFFSLKDCANNSEYGNQNRYQGGVSALLRRKWSNGTKSEVSAFFSGLYSKQKSASDSIDFALNERVSQYNVSIHQSGLKSDSDIVFGAEFQAYRVKSDAVHMTLFQPSLFITKKLTYKGLDFEAGLRSDFVKSSVNLQPRVMLKFHFLKYFSLSSAWGVYNQYLVKNPYALANGYYNFIWSINTSLKSYNSVAGIGFSNGAVSVSAEAFLKNIRHSQWVVNNVSGYYNFNLKGIDVSATYKWRHGLLFSSWSVLKDPRQTDGVANEVKVGGIFRFFPFSFSSDYVYGHGYNSLLLPANSYVKNADRGTDGFTNNSLDYSRLDCSASYEKSFGKVTLNVGASLINIFDTNNKKYTSTWIPRKYSSAYVFQASRFTPVIFIAVKF
jgi:hypothetical protein